MSQLHDAQNRLRAAIERLEAAVDRTVSGVGSDGLESDLAAVRIENAQLSRTTQEITNRLDSAIDRIRLVLDS